MHDRSGRQCANSGFNPLTAEQLRRCNRIHTFHTCLIGFICVIIAQSQKGILNYRPSTLLCSYSICKIVLQSHISLIFAASRSPAEQFVHQNNQFPYYSAYCTLIGSATVPSDSFKSDNMFKTIFSSTSI